jgi:hypothetical protein
MTVTIEEALLRLKKGYEDYCDIEQPEVTDIPLKEKYTFRATSEKYVLTKKAVLWSADTNEHIYVFAVPHLTKDIYDRCRKYAYEEGMKLVEPKSGHMYTYLVAHFVCEDADEEAVRALKKCRIYKSFRFSLHGWMEFHTGLICLNNGKVTTNGAGKRNAKFLKNIIHVQSKK